MKADMDSRGVITLTPETGSEAFALQAWAHKARIEVDDVMRNEQIHFRGSMLLVKLETDGAA